MYSQVSNLFLPKLPCTRFQSVIEMVFASCVCPFSLPLVPVPEDVPSGTSPHKRGMCNTMSTWRHTQRILQKQQTLIIPHNPPSGESEMVIWPRVLSPPGTNGWQRLWVYIPRGYFNPSLSPSTKLRLSSSDRQRKTEFLTFIPIMTITTIYTKKYMDINVYSSPHRLDVMILNVNYLGQCG